MVSQFFPGFRHALATHHHYSGIMGAICTPFPEADVGVLLWILCHTCTLHHSTPRLCT
jgi:hypothetical protein